MNISGENWRVNLTYVPSSREQIRALIDWKVHSYGIRVHSKLERSTRSYDRSLFAIASGEFSSVFEIPPGRGSNSGRENSNSSPFALKDRQSREGIAKCAVKTRGKSRSSTLFIGVCSSEWIGRVYQRWESLASTLLAKQLAFDQVCVTANEGVLEEVSCDEQQPQGSRGILKDHGDDPEKLCVVDEAASSPGRAAAGDKGEIEIESIDRHVAADSQVYACGGKPRGKSGKTIGHFEFRDDYVVKYAGRRHWFRRFNHCVIVWEWQPGVFSRVFCRDHHQGDPLGNVYFTQSRARARRGTFVLFSCLLKW